MENKISVVPKLLTDGAARSLNNKMLNKNLSFVFLGEQDTLLYRTPLSFAEAFEMYIIRLYVLYHDYGMYFLTCYLKETPNGDKCLSHIKFINSCRTALGHANNPEVNQKVYYCLKNYYFKSNQSFENTYKDWLEFRKNAGEPQWKTLVEKIVRDSDNVMSLLDNIADQKSKYQKECQIISDIFLNKRICSYAKIGDKEVDIYTKSFDGRFLRSICSNLNSEIWADDNIAKFEMKAIMDMKPKKRLQQYGSYMLEPSEIVQELIDLLIDSLKSDTFSDSELLYVKICQDLKELIDEEIRKAQHNDDDDFFS